MRLFSLILLLAIISFMDACTVAPCPTWILRTRPARTTTTTSPHTHHPQAKKCSSDNDCRYHWMETEVPCCGVDGYCHNYDMVRGPGRQCNSRYPNF